MKFKISINENCDTIKNQLVNQGVTEETHPFTFKKIYELDFLLYSANILKKKDLISESTYKSMLKDVEHGFSRLI